MAAPGAAPDAVRYVVTKAIAAGVKGRETDILGKLGIDWRKGGHISCPYPDHHDRNPSWRFDNKTGRALCTCITKSDGIFDIVMKVKRLDFEAAKIRVAEFIDRSDLIKVKVKVKGNGTGQKTDAASLLNPPAAGRNDSLVALYLAARLGLDNPAAVPMPTTKAVGWKQLGYYDPPSGKEKKFKLVASPPCLAFETVAHDGRKHAHRIYLSADGRAKAELGSMSNGRQRDPKKSARRLDGQPSTAGCCVIWGDVETAPHEIVFEGIENAAAGAYSFADEIATGEIVVVSAINAGGIEAFTPWPAAQTLTVGADRDEGKPGAGFKRGETAARTLALKKFNGQQPITHRLALPGEPGTSFDFVDLLLKQGALAVREALLGAQPIVATPEEIAELEQRAVAEQEIEEIKRLYPLPLLEGLRVESEVTRHNGIWIYKIVLKETKTGELEEIHTAVCSPFGVVALLDIQDADGKADGLRVHVRGRDGKPHTVDFECAGLARVAGSDIRARLMEAGLRVEQDGEFVAVQLCKAANPSTLVKAVVKSGWRSAALFMSPAGEKHVRRRR